MLWEILTGGIVMVEAADIEILDRRNLAAVTDSAAMRRALNLRPFVRPVAKHVLYRFARAVTDRRIVVSVSKNRVAAMAVLVNGVLIVRGLVTNVVRTFNRLEITLQVATLIR